ncbi:MAG: NAD(P)H-hydrate dehydratase [Ruminococcaceae bacterium]|nr:NAD(P)H-hydrate dehydratase [Oscillospiraceae bacterium]
MLFLSVNMIREAEKHALENVSSMHLIENVAKVCFEELKNFGSVRVYCGKGNNGSDGYATAIILKKHGKRVEIVPVAEPESPECQLLYQKALDEEIPITHGVTFPTEEFECSLDAIFGIGIKGEITDSNIIRAIETINASDGYVVSCDVPSGMDSDTGKACGISVKADKTVTFTAPKRGMLSNESVDLCGEIVIAEVGIPVDYNTITESTCVPLTKKLLKTMIPARSRYSHKGTFGTAVIVAGSRSMSGAAAMAAMAAVRSGCGMVKIVAPSPICAVLNILVKEAIVIPVPEQNGVMLPNLSPEAINAIKTASSVLVGCGIGKGDHDLLISNILNAASCPVIVDADGINALSGKMKIVQNKNVLLTPHPKEFSRISGYDISLIESRRIQSADKFARENGIHLLLKGARTVITYGGSNKYVCPLATSALAKAGSGDILAGIIASFAAQGLSLTDAAATGCFIHAYAGMLGEKRIGAYSVTADDIINLIAPAIVEILK